MSKPLIVDKAYPTTDNLTRDAASLCIISPAYASSESELNSTLQYVYHSICFSKSGREDIAEVLISIAIAEMLHLELLGKTLYCLGAAPVYARFPASRFDFYSAKYVSYSRTLHDMLEDDLIGERHAIAGYEKMLKNLRNGQCADIISRISEDERLHAEKLESILSTFKR